LHIYSSDLDRAAATAAVIAEALNVELIHDAQYREENYGILEGHTTDEIKRCPTLHRAWQERQRLKEKGGCISKTNNVLSDHTAIELETSSSCEWESSFYQRTIQALESTRQFLDTQQRRLVVVTHGGFIINAFRYVHGYAEGYPVIRDKLCPFIGNTSISILRYDGIRQAWVSLAWGTYPHMALTPR
jgi:broad specificity phosphatase PhoE